jgi:hypothetical protein
MEAFLETCSDPVHGRVVWQEAPIALGWAEWEQQERRFAFGLIEQHLTELIAGGHIEALPFDTTARVAFAMHGAAGQALSVANEEDKPRLREEYRMVIGRLLMGLVASRD